MVDEFIVYDDVQFITRGWINRNNLLINGEAKRFTVSLSGASSNKMINEIDVLDDFTNLRKTLTVSYAKAPYINETLRVFDAVCSFKDKNLAKFIDHSFECIGDYIGISTPRRFSSDIEKDNSLRAQDKIIDIAKRIDATRYINSIGGVELYDNQKFIDNGLELKFLKTKPVTYKQFKDTFVPNLSIIDVMMFNDAATIKEMLQQYELVS